MAAGPRTWPQIASGNTSGLSDETDERRARAPRTAALMKTRSAPSMAPIAPYAERSRATAEFFRTENSRPSASSGCPTTSATNAACTGIRMIELSAMIDLAPSKAASNKTAE